MAIDVELAPNPAGSLGKTTVLETIMALSLYGERPVTAASSAHPLAAFARVLQRVRAARARRIALAALLELDHCRLDDLGIDRQDVVNAMRNTSLPAGRQLSAARTAKAHR